MKNELVNSARARKTTIGVIAFVTFTGLLIPIAMFHELGHIIACNAFGGTGILTGISSGSCLSDGQNIVIVRFAGGAFGIAGSLVPLALWSRLKDDLWYRGILVGMLALAVWDFEKALLEAFSFQFYESYYVGAVMFTGALVSAVVLFFVFIRPNQQMQDRP